MNPNTAYNPCICATWVCTGAILHISSSIKPLSPICVGSYALKYFLHEACSIKYICVLVKQTSPNAPMVQRIIAGNNGDLSSGGFDATDHRRLSSVNMMTTNANNIYLIMKARCEDTWECEIWTRSTCQKQKRLGTSWVLHRTQKKDQLW